MGGCVRVAPAGLVGGGDARNPHDGSKLSWGLSLAVYVFGSDERVVVVLCVYVHDFAECRPSLVDCFELLFGQSFAVCEF